MSGSGITGVTVGVNLGVGSSGGKTTWHVPSSHLSSLSAQGTTVGVSVAVGTAVSVATGVGVGICSSSADEENTANKMTPATMAAITPKIIVGKGNRDISPP